MDGKERKNKKKEREMSKLKILNLLNEKFEEWESEKFLSISNETSKSGIGKRRITQVKGKEG